MIKRVVPLLLMASLLTACSSEVKDVVQNNTTPIETPEFTTEDALSLFEVKDDIPENVLATMLGKSLPNKEVAKDLSFLTITYIDYEGETQVGNLVVNKKVAHEVLDIFKEIYEAKFPIERMDLVLTITYIDYEGETQVGNLVVNKKVAHEVLDIFKEIYEAKFPIERMDLVDLYDAEDNKSMLANNTSSFNYRAIAGTDVLSNHGKGVAIDINPFYNPHVINGKTSPTEAQKYADRTLNDKGMIKAGDVVHKAFTSRGWTWGGDWKNPDYQHFEKEIG